MSSFFDEFGSSPSRAEEAFAPSEVNKPILGVDVGSVYTRAIFLDSASGMYRIFAQGQAPTTTGPPWNNALYGMAWALEQITEATRHALVNDRLQLVMPEREGGIGVDTFVGTFSGGRPLNVVIVGLMEQFGVQSALRACETTYFTVRDIYSLARNRSLDEMVHDLIEEPPEVIIITGGTNGGAEGALRQRLAAVSMACAALERAQRPAVIYAANTALAEEATDVLDPLVPDFYVAPNPHPAFGVSEPEGLAAQLLDLYQVLHTRITGGFEEVREWSLGLAFPTAQGFGQMVEVLGYLDDETVVGIDIGSSATTLAVYAGGELTLRVFNDLGIGHELRTTLERIPLDSITRWGTALPESLEESRDLLWNRWLYPHTLPVTAAQRDLDYGLVREILREVQQRTDKAIPPADTLLLSGAVLTSPPHNLLSVMDSFEMSGVTRVISDIYGAAPMLGLIAAVSPRAVVQVLDSGAFEQVATLITGPRRGQLTMEDGSTQPFNVAAGSLQTVPLAYGAEAALTVGSSDPRPISGSLFGVVVDAREHPLRLPRDANARQDLLTGWLRALKE